MKILVTGAAGFVGLHLVRRLIDAGHQTVALILQAETAAALPAGVAQVVVCDLAASAAAVAAAIPPGCDAAVHLAGRLGDWGVSDPSLWRDNVTATGCLLEALPRRGIRRLLHASTPGVVGFSGVAGEEAPLAPRGPYERSKAEAERLLLARAPELGIAVLVLRPDFVYGPGDRRRLGLLRAWRDGLFFYIAGGRSLIHPTYVGDVADAFTRALGSSLEQTVLNIAGPRPVSWRELSETGCELLGVAPPRWSLPRPLARGAGRLCELSFALLGREPPLTANRVDFMSRDHASQTERARALLGWQAATDLRTGLRQTIDWARNQGLL